MKTFLRIASAILLFCPALLASGNPGVSSYRISIEPEVRVLKVEAELTLENNELRIAEVGADQFANRWATFIKDLKVTGPAGQAIGVKELTGGGWQLDAGEGMNVTVSYTVVLDHEKHEWASGIDGAAYQRDWGVFSVGRAFAVMNGSSRKNIGIAFDLPKGWHVSGSWAEESPGVFRAADNNDLSESMFFAGTHKEFSIERDRFRLQFAIGGPGVIEQEEQFSALSEGVLDYYVMLMGGIPKPPPGVRLDKVLVVVSPGKSTDGEVIGTHISMILDTGGDPMGALISRFIFAHELFHLWNGKSIIPASTDEEWFKEGVSNYYTVKALRKAGIIDEAAMFGVLNGLFFQRYSSDPEYGKRSISDLSAGDKKHEHWGMIYGGGLFAGICEDVRIRKSSGNSKSLDDLIVGLFRRFGGSTNQYTREHLVPDGPLGKTIQSELLEKSVYGADPVPIDKCLREAGLNAEIIEGQLKISRKTNESVEERKMIDEMFGGR